VRSSSLHENIKKNRLPFAAYVSMISYSSEDSNLCQLLNRKSVRYLIYGYHIDGMNEFWHDEKIFEVRKYKKFVRDATVVSQQENFYLLAYFVTIKLARV